MVVIKGSGFSDISRQLGIMGIFAVLLNVWAVLNDHKGSKRSSILFSTPTVGSRLTSTTIHFL
jgi:hypothetical protein